MRPRFAVRIVGVTSRVSVSASGAQANGSSSENAMSTNGRYVAFTSLASNLVPDDTTDVVDVFVRDRRAGTTARISVSSRGAQADNHSFGTSISADGRYVVFESNASDLVSGDTNNATDAFVRDRRAGTTSRVSVSATGAQAAGGSFGQSISANGRCVAFASWSPDLVPGDTNEAADVFVRERAG
jgi:Tol biopolymer transport system component